MHYTIKTVYHEEMDRLRADYRFPVPIESIVIIVLAGLFLLPSLYQLSIIGVEPAWLDQPFATLLWAQLAVWVMQVVLFLRAVKLGIQLLHHPHTSPVYALLIVQGVSTWRVLLAKWWAALHWIASYALALGLIRLLILPITMFANIVPGIASEMEYLSCAYFRPADCPGIQIEGMDWFLNNAVPDWALQHLIAAPVFALLITLLETLAVTAIGLASAALFQQRIGVLVTAIFWRITVSLLVLSLIISREYGMVNSLFRLYRASTSYALVDNGTVATLRFLYHPVIAQERLPRNGLDLLLAIGLLIVLLLSALFFARLAMKRKRVLVGLI
jgi:hypothetical protein